MTATYTLGSTAIAFGNNKSMLSGFNATGSGVILRLYRVWVLNNQTAAVTGVLTTWALRRTTAQSSGSAVTPVKHDTNSANFPAQVTAATGATVTLSDTFRTWVWSNDEPSASAGTSDEFECIVPLNCVWDSGYGDTNIEPLVCRETFGFSVQHSGSTTVGVVDVFAEVTCA